jgi:hypothetical protein
VKFKLKQFLGKRGELAPAYAGMASWQVGGGLLEVVSLLNGPATPVDEE